MQFSLRRLLFAVAVYAATLGVLTFYAERFGMLRSGSDATWWWATAIVTAFGMSGISLVVRRSDLRHIRNAIVWTIVGMIAGALLSADSPPEFAIPGGMVGGLVGCILFRRSPRPPTRPAR